MLANAVRMRPKTVRIPIGMVKACDSVAWKGDILVVVMHTGDVTRTISLLERTRVDVPVEEEVEELGELALLYRPAYEVSKQRTTVRRVE